MPTRLHVDPTRCDGFGYCAEIFPEGIFLDDWGFPILDASDIATARDAKNARRAVRHCPRAALFIDDAADG